MVVVVVDGGLLPLLREPRATGVGRAKPEGGDEPECGQVVQASIAVCVRLAVLMRDVHVFFRGGVARRIDVTLGLFAAAVVVA